MESLNDYPRQGSWVNKRCIVIFDYDNTIQYSGTIIREDLTSPFLTIIKLDSGEIILSKDCQYQIV